MEELAVDNRPKWGRGCSSFCLIPQRIICTLMGFLSLICMFTHRISLSLVITIITVPINRTNSNNTHEDVCPEEDTGTSEGPKSQGIYNWSEQMQSNILGIFYAGYIISHLPGGILADKYGAKWVLGIGTLLSAIFTILSHTAIVYGDWWLLMLLRVGMGIAQGPAFPALSVLLSAWVPRNERGTLATFCYSGSTMGIIVSNSCSGYLLSVFPWPVTFYVFGGAGLIWFFTFIFLCTSSPDTHPCIKPEELQYLVTSIGHTNKDKPPIPWRPLLLSVPLLAMFISQVGHDWGYYVMVTFLPKYMADVIRFSIRSNGFYTSLPYIAMWLASFFSGLLADWLIRTNKMELFTERKIFTLLAGLGPGIFMVIASYAGCDKVAVVILFTICMLLMGPYYAGQKLTAIDMSPSYAGTIMALANGGGAIAGLLVGPTVGALTPKASLHEWRVVFILAFIILTISAVVFWFFGTGDVQPYDPLYNEHEKDGDKKK